MTVAELIRELQAMPQHMYVRFENNEPQHTEDLDTEVRDVRNEGQFILLKGE